MKFLNIFANLEFARSFSILRKSYQSTFIAVAIDISFFLIALTGGKIAEPYIRIGGIADAVYLTNALLISLLYYIFVLLLYSSLKLSVLGLIRSSVDKVKFRLGSLGRFCLLSFLLALIAAAAYFALALALAGIKQEFAWIAVACLSAYAIILYIVWNMAHSFFAAGHSVKDSLLSGLKSVKNKRVYLGVLIPSFLLTIILALPYSMVYLRAGLSQIFIAVFEAAAYLIFIVNRAGFYLIAKESQ